MFRDSACIQNNIKEEDNFSDCLMDFKTYFVVYTLINVNHDHQRCLASLLLPDFIYLRHFFNRNFESVSRWNKESCCPMETVWQSPSSQLLFGSSASVCSLMLMMIEFFKSLTCFSSDTRRIATQENIVCKPTMDFFGMWPQSCSA